MEPKKEKSPFRKKVTSIGLVILVIFLCFCTSPLGEHLVDFAFPGLLPLHIPIQIWQEIPPDQAELAKLNLVKAWQYQAEGKIHRVVGLANDKVVIYTYHRRFIGLDIASGQPVWQYQASGPIKDLESRHELLLKDGLLVFNSFIGNSVHNKLTVVEAETGQELWSRDDRQGGYAAATFAVGDKYVYWALWPHYLAFDRYTGDLAWQSELEMNSSGYDDLLYDNDEITIIRRDMYVLDANTGEIKRSLDFKINSTLLRIYEGVIYFFAFGKGRAMDTQKNIVLWERPVENIQGSRISWTPLLRDNRIYLGLNGSLGVLATDTGEVIWGKKEYNKKEAILASNPVFVGNTIYAMFSDGSLRAFKDEDGTEIGRVEFGVAFKDAALSATQDRLFVSLGGRRLYAYDIFSGEAIQDAKNRMVFN